jgi:hypothetical protein
MQQFSFIIVQHLHTHLYYIVIVTYCTHKIQSFPQMLQFKMWSVLCSGTGPDLTPVYPFAPGSCEVTENIQTYKKRENFIT